METARDCQPASSVGTARTPHATAVGRGGITKNAAAGDTLFAAEEGAVAAAAGAASFLSDLFSAYSELGLLSLASCAVTANPAALSLAAVKELLHAWEATRRSVAACWTAAVSRFQRLLLFIPRSELCCARQINAAREAATRAAGGGTEATFAGATAAGKKESAAKEVVGEAGASRSTPSVTSCPSSAARVKEASKDGDAGRVIAGRQPAAAYRRDAPTAGNNMCLFVQGRCSSITGVVMDNVAINSSSGIGENCVSEVCTGVGLERNSGAVLQQQHCITACFEGVDIPAASNGSFNSADFPRSADAVPCEIIYPHNDGMIPPDGLGMLASFDEFLRQKRVTRLSQTGQRRTSEQQLLQEPQLEEQHSQQLQQLQQAVSRGLLLRLAGRNAGAAAAWGQYALPGVSDTYVVYQDPDQTVGTHVASATAAAAQLETSRTAATTDAPALRRFLAAGQRSTTDVVPVPATEIQPLAPRATSEPEAAGQIGGRAARAVEGEVSAAGTLSAPINREILRPSPAATAAALELSNAQSCAEAIAEALLSSPPAARRVADRCSHVLCIMAEVEGSLTLMQQQQVDCLRRIFRRVWQQLVTGFLTKIQKVDSMQSYNVRSCESLYCCGGDSSSCPRTIDPTGSAMTPKKNSRAIQRQRQHPVTANAVAGPQDRSSSQSIALNAEKAHSAAGTMPEIRNTGVISRLELLLGLHVTCEALLQRNCTVCDSATYWKEYWHSEETLPAERAATVAELQTPAVRTGNALAVATAYKGVALKGSASCSTENVNVFPFGELKGSGENRPPAGAPLPETVMAAHSPSTTAVSAKTFSKCTAGGSRGSYEIKAATPAKIEKAPPAAVGVHSRVPDTGLAEPAAGAKSTFFFSQTKYTHSRRAGEFFDRPEAKYQPDIEKSEGRTGSDIPLLRRAALHHIRTAAAEILQSCGKLMQLLEYVDQAIQEALGSQSTSDNRGGERKGILAEAGETLPQGTALVHFLEPLDLPSAAAALDAVERLQEGSPKPM